MKRKKRETLIDEQLLLKKSLQKKQGRGKQIEGHVGRITNVITGAISADALEGSLLAPAEQAERDRKVLERLRQTDGEKFLNRKGKFVMIDAYEMRVIAALSYLISPEIDAEDIQDIIRNPKANKHITRTFKLGDLAKVIHDKRELSYKRKIFDSLREIDGFLQVFPIGNNKIRLQHFFRIQHFDVDFGEGKESVTIDLGLVFFLNLNNSFAYCTPQVFLAWGKNGRQTELYARLQFHLLTILTARKESYFAQTKKLRDEARYCKLTGDDRKQFQKQKEEEIEQVKTGLMFYEINVDSIKRKVSTDYDDRRTKGKFKTHFEAAVEGYKEASILLDGELVKGKRGQQKAVFKLNLDYGTDRLLP